jgi:hypothetical protein
MSSGLAGATAPEEAQHRVGGALAQVAGADETAAVALRDLVEGLDKHRKADRCVEVALRDMEAEPLGPETEPDHQEEAEAQNHDRGMGADEVHQRTACDHQQHHSDNDGGHHHSELIDHPDRRDHGIEREHGVEHDDLHHGLPEARMAHRPPAYLAGAFEPFVQLARRLPDQE